MVALLGKLWGNPAAHPPTCTPYDLGALLPPLYKAYGKRTCLCRRSHAATLTCLAGSSLVFTTPHPMHGALIATTPDAHPLHSPGAQLGCATGARSASERGYVRAHMTGNTGGLSLPLAGACVGRTGSLPSLLSLQKTLTVLSWPPPCQNLRVRYLGTSQCSSASGPAPSMCQLPWAQPRAAQASAQPMTAC